MSVKMSRQEFREMALGQSYLSVKPEPPDYFADLFELIAFPEGEQTKIDLYYADVAVDTVEKLGLVEQAHDTIAQLIAEARSLGRADPVNPKQFALSRLLRLSKYHVYMLIWSTRALLDTLAVHLNGMWSLKRTGKDIWVGSSGLRDALRKKRPTLAARLDREQDWFTTVDEYRLFTIRREPLVVVPNADLLKVIRKSDAANDK